MADEIDELDAGPFRVGPRISGRNRKLTGWLLKRKSEGVASRLFRSANRRFFTLDYEAQLFYYSQSEGHKTLSLPVAFRNLVSVEPYEAVLPEGPTEDQDPQVLNPGEVKPNRHIAVPKISFGALKRAPAEHHGFVLHMVGKEMELLCSSKAEADRWITGLREAISLGAEARESEPLKVELSTSAGSSPEAPLSPRSDGGESVPEVLVPPTPEALAKLPNSPRNQHAFGSEPVETKEQRPARRGLGGLIPRRLRRQSREASANEGVVTSLNFEDADSHAWEDDNPARDIPLSSEVSKRYEDKARGLSLKERLAQMDFSDDEDE